VGKMRKVVIMRKGRGNSLQSAEEEPPSRKKIEKEWTGNSRQGEKKGIAWIS